MKEVVKNDGNSEGSKVKEKEKKRKTGNKEKKKRTKDREEMNKHMFVSPNHISKSV